MSRNPRYCLPNVQKITEGLEMMQLQFLKSPIRLVHNGGSGSQNVSINQHPKGSYHIFNDVSFIHECVFARKLMVTKPR